MALFSCPDCRKQISTDAGTCPNCGCSTFDLPTGQKRRVTCPECKGGKGSCEECGGWGGWDEKEYKSVKDGSTRWVWVGGIGQPGAPFR